MGKIVNVLFFVGAFVLGGLLGGPPNTHFIKVSVVPETSDEQALGEEFDNEFLYIDIETFGKTIVIPAKKVEEYAKNAYEAEALMNDFDIHNKIEAGFFVSGKNLLSKNKEEYSYKFDALDAKELRMVFNALRGFEDSSDKKVIVHYGKAYYLCGTFVGIALLAGLIAVIIMAGCCLLPDKFINSWFYRMLDSFITLFMAIAVVFWLLWAITLILA